MYSRSRESSAGTDCASKGAAAGERPERRSCFSTCDSIRLVSCPWSDKGTITGSRWSIHKPANVFISFSPFSLESGGCSRFVSQLPWLTNPPLKNSTHFRWRGEKALPALARARRASTSKAQTCFTPLVVEGGGHPHPLWFFGRPAHRNPPPRRTELKRRNSKALPVKLSGPRHHPLHARALDPHPALPDRLGIRW